MVELQTYRKRGKIRLTNKNDIRLKIKEEKSKYPISEIKKNSKIIIDKLMTSREYLNSNRIFTYVSFNQEVITRDLINETLKYKKVAVPRISDNKMSFYHITSLDDLQPGIKGILEPITTELAFPKEEDLFVVPGLAFDRKRGRIGYGKGYYDMYFREFDMVDFHKIALAFDFQIITNIPIDDHDVTLDSIITPTETII